MRWNSGRWMELLAACLVATAGYRIVRRNYLVPRIGEIDIIAVHRDLVVSSYGTGLDSVGVHKQRRILATAMRFLQRHPSYGHHRCRFDVISISRPNYLPRLQWTRNAFTHDDASPAASADPADGPDSLRFLE